MESQNEKLKNYVLKLQLQETKESNARIQDPESMMDASTLNHNEGVLIFDTFKDAYHIVKWTHNENYPFETTLSGYDSLQRMVHPDERTYVVNGKLEALKLKEKCNDPDIFSYKLMYECSLKDKNGNYRRFHFQYSIAEQDDCGDIRFLLLLINEIGEYDAEKPARGMCTYKRFADQLHAIDTETCLTKTEITVLKLLSKGYDSTKVAAELANSVYTINNHRCKVLDKLGANNVAQAVRYGLMMEII